MSSPDATKTAAIDAFVEEIREETDPWRKARLLAFLRKERWHQGLLEEARKAYDAEKDREPGDRQCYWAALELITEPSTNPPEEGALWIEPVSGVCFVRIAPGTFDMGSDEGPEEERPIHNVTITREYWLARHPITNGEYRRYLQANPDAPEPYSLKSDWHNNAGRPVVGDDRVGESLEHEAHNRYCAWLRAETGHPIHLPTEAEWEYACRAGSSAEWCFGDDQGHLNHYAWCDGWRGEPRGSHPVGLKRPNLWGLQDMHGNVWEWCWDWFGGYSREHAVDPTGPPSGTIRVIRGGSWVDNVSLSRCAGRFEYTPGDAAFFVGFRPALSPVRRTEGAGT
jgi:formylglycine-generating enzyme required for sulfatase activity